MRTPPPCCDSQTPYGVLYDKDLPSRARFPLASDNRYAFLALTPKFLLCSSEWLGVLKLAHRAYLKQSKGGLWGLKEVIQNDWIKVEENLHSVSQRLELHIPLAYLDAQACPLPRSYGYLKLHPTRAAAERAIERSLDGFMVYIGYCSFLLLRRNRPIDDFDTRRCWEIDLIRPPARASREDINLLRFRPFEPAHIQTIKSSELVDFKIPRAGVIVSSTCQFLREIRILIDYDIPVYFYWGRFSVTERYDSRFPYQQLYAPDTNAINAAFRAYDDALAHEREALALRERALDHTAPSDASPSTDGQEPFPKRFPGSLQKPYEGPWDYLHRRAHAIAKFYKNSDPIEKKSFKARAAAQREFPYPGRGGPLTFFWDEGEKHYNGYIVRVPYGRSKTAQEWSWWHNSHKRFDPSTNSWDLFSDPIPSATLHYSHLLSPDSPNHPPPPSLPTPTYKTPYDGPYNDPGFEDYEMPTASSILPSPPMDVDDNPANPGVKDTESNSALPIASSVPTSPPMDVEDSPAYPGVEDTQSDSTQEGSNAIFSPSLSATSLPTEWEPSDHDRKWQEASRSLDHDDHSQVVETLYKFSDHRDILDNLYERFGFTIGNPASPITSRQWTDCQKWVGHHKSSSLPSEQTASVYHFISSLITNQDNLTALQQISDHDIALNAHHPADIAREEGFSFLPNQLSDGSFCYVVDNIDTHVSNRWVLVLTDPVTVVQCMRTHFHGSLKNMARYLYHSGIPFNTCILRAIPNDQDIIPYKPLSLGWRPSGHGDKPTTADYGNYQATLDELFTRSYARAALLEGGIVWRIALLYLKDSELDVTRGPSIDAALLGKRWMLEGGSIMYDDRLSESEMDVICGVYEIPTGKYFFFNICWSFKVRFAPGRGQQTSHMSWWPKQSLFLKSGLWPGYWSPQCEEWFQGRLNQILGHTARLRKSSSWPNSLKYYKSKTVPFVLANAKASGEYIKRLTT